MGERPADYQGTERFQVLSKLGSGATGVVYAAEDRSTGGRVALKVLRNLSPEAVADFKQEFRALADLDHPNLVKLGELIADGDRWLITMELVDGVDFISHVRPEGALDGERLRAALVQLMAALEALHATGQVHRDVKPSNVLVRDGGAVKLLDFGLVTAADDGEPKRSETVAVGTTAYVAPEQAAGRAVSPPADFYALGVMLYEALTGRLPYEGPPLKILMDKQSLRPVPPSVLAPGTEPELEKLCLELLSPEPAQRPGAARIVEKLRGRRTRAQASQPTRSQAFFGREAELEQLVAALGGRAATRSVQFVLGASGIGKSALFARLGRKLAATGSLVLFSRSRADESVPYRALDGAFDELGHVLSRASGELVQLVLPRHAGLLGRTFPALARVDAIARAPLDGDAVANPVEQRRRAFAALRDLLQGLARRKNVVLVIDDLHHADDDSLALLKALLRGPDAPPVGLVASVNPAMGRAAGGPGWDASELVATLARGAPTLTLGGLDEPAAEALVSHLLELDPPQSAPPARAIARAAEGHPRLIEELVQHVREHPSEASGLTLEQVVARRTEGLAPSALHLLTLLAIAGAPVSADVLRHATALDAQELAREITGLKLVRLVRAIGVRGRERVELYHDLVRAAVLRQLPPDEQRVHHRTLALAHEVARTDDWAAMARHFRAAGMDDRAADYAARAADAALAALAFARAAQLYQEAVELRGPATGPELYARLGDALVSAGRGPQGARAYLAAAGGGVTAADIDLRRRAAEQFMVSGHAAEGLETARRVVRDLDLRVSENASFGRMRATARLLGVELRGLSFRDRDTSEISAMDLVRIDACWSLFVGLAAIEPMRVADPLSLHLVLALRAGEPMRVGRALSAISTMSGMLRGQAQRAQELAERAEAITERLGHPHLLGLCQLNQGLRAYHGGDLELAKSQLAQAERTLQEGCRGALWEIAVIQFFSLMCHLAAGDVATLGRRAAEVYDEASVRGDLLTMANLRARVLPTVALLAGQPERAREYAEVKLGSAQEPRMSMQAYWREVSLIEQELYAGNPRAALARIRALFPTLARERLLGIRAVYLEAHWLRARATLGAMAAGDPDARGRDVLRDASRIELSNDMGGSLGLSLSLRAALAELEGERANASAAFRGAEAQLRADGRALLAQLARLRRGLIGTESDDERARRDAEVWLHGAGVADAGAVLRVYIPGRA